MITRIDVLFYAEKNMWSSNVGNTYLVLINWLLYFSHLLKLHLGIIIHWEIFNVYVSATPWEGAAFIVVNVGIVVVKS